MESKYRKKIGVFGHYGNKNIGDEAIIAAVVQNIKYLKPGAIIYGFSINPSDTEERHKIISFPIRRLKNKSSSKIYDQSDDVYKNELKIGKKNNQFGWKNRFKKKLDKNKSIKTVVKLPFQLYSAFSRGISEIFFIHRSYKILKGMDKLFISGSNQFLDNFGGIFGFPYTLLKWTVIARLARVKVFFLSIGAGPIKSKISQIMIKICILLCEHISFRDHGSKQLVGQQDNQKAKVVPDLALSYNDVRKNIEGKKDNGLKDKKKIGINPMPVHDKRYWPVGDDQKYRLYTEKLSELYIDLKRNGFDPFFYNTQISDLLVIEDIISHINGASHLVENAQEVTVIKNETLEELMANIRSADILVPTRFHGIILSYMANKPVVGICYGKKSKELMSNMDQNRYAFDIDEFNVSQIVSAVKEVKSSYDYELNKIRKIKKYYEQELNNQYDDILK